MIISKTPGGREESESDPACSSNKPDKRASSNFCGFRGPVPRISKETTNGL